MATWTKERWATLTRDSATLTIAWIDIEDAVFSANHPDLVIYIDFLLSISDDQILCFYHYKASLCEIALVQSQTLEIQILSEQLLGPNDDDKLEQLHILRNDDLIRSNSGKTGWMSNFHRRSDVLHNIRPLFIGIYQTEDF